MNKSKLVRSLLFSLALLSVATSASALSSNVHIKFDCPSAAAKSNAITNYGSYISGHGTETIGGNTSSKAIFTGSVPTSANIPADLKTGGYTNSGTAYQTNTGMVICKYASSIGFSPFELGYTMNNGTGGTVTRSTLDSLTLVLAIGAKR